MLFGNRDILSGWVGECQECNIRWYRMQIRCACRGLLRDNLCHVGIQATALIYRFADLDIKFQRRGESLRRALKMRKSLLTNPVYSDDEYFDGIEAAVHAHPMTLLDDTGLAPNLETQFFTDVPSIPRSILDVVATFLIKSNAGSDHCDHLAWLQSRDYNLETGWCNYEWQGRAWLHNAETGAWFYVDTMQQSTAGTSWQCYKYGIHYWWLRCKQWFWDPRTLPQCATRREIS
jgi:hypothetical protein